MKAYLTKWVPPRADFLPTITKREEDLFRQHGDWQNGLRETGQIVAHGPVIDPTGSYGVAIWEIDDEAERNGTDRRARPCHRSYRQLRRRNLGDRR